MAHIIPYGDPLAYGKFAGNIVFRRYRGGTTIITKSRPRYRRTPAQAAVRDKFKDASQAYNMLTSKSRDFYRARAPQVGLCVRDFYMRGFMKDKIPTTLPGIDMKSISKMVLFKTAGSKQNNFDIYIEAAEKTQQQGEIILWCKMESAADIGSPTIGPSGSPQSQVTYPPMKFNNGADIVDSEGSIEFGSVPTNDLKIKGMHGLYWQPHYSSDTVSENSIWSLWESSLSDGITCFYSEFYGGLTIEINQDGSKARYTFPITFTANQLQHSLSLWDVNNPVGSRIRYWQNGIEITPIITNDNVWSIPNPITYLLFNAFEGNQDCGYDNIKLYNGVDDLNLALGNINNEGLPLVPTGNWIAYASIEDASNTFTQLNTIDYQTNQRIHIHEKGNVPVDIPFRYLFTLDYLELDDTFRSAAVRLPKLYLAPQSHTYLYFCNDWSDYWDDKLWHLACTDNL